MIFYRSDHTTLFIQLDSDEPLGILDTDYVEDYNGVDGQLSVYNVTTTTRTAMVMVSQPAQTPGVDNDVFLGQLPLASLPNGDYEIQGRVRDLIGNHTILTRFNSPIGNETVINMLFEIKDGELIPRPGAFIQVQPYDDTVHYILPMDRNLPVNGPGRNYIL